MKPLALLALLILAGCQTGQSRLAAEANATAGQRPYAVARFEWTSQR